MKIKHNEDYVMMKKMNRSENYFYEQEKTTKNGGEKRWVEELTNRLIWFNDRSVLFEQERTKSTKNKNTGQLA